MGLANKELGRLRRREGEKERLLCDDECESSSWSVGVSSLRSLRNDFMSKVQELLGDMI